MAHLSRRRPERRLIPRAAVLASLLAIAGPGSVRAQQPDSSAFSTTLHVEGSLRLSRLRGENVRLAGAAVLLRLNPRLAFGLEGWSLLSDLIVQRPGGSLDFGLGYGGVVGEFRLHETPGSMWAARLLVGAGTGKLSLPAVGTEIEADNFGVLEPELTASLGLAGPLRLSAAAGYRTVYGVQDLPGVDAPDLRGWTARISLGLNLF